MSPRNEYEDESPPYSPTASEMERPVFSPRQMHDLKQSCAVLVAMTNPPDPDDEPDHNEYLRRLEAERRAKHDRLRAQESKAMKTNLQRVGNEDLQPKPLETKASKKEKKDIPRRYSTRRPRQEKEQSFSREQPDHYIPTGQPGEYSIESPEQKSPEIPMIIGEPVLPPVHAPIVERIREKQRKLAARTEAEELRRRQEQAKRRLLEDEALGHIRKSMHMRPKTSAAACVDYEGDPIPLSSNSTSRSNSDYAAVNGRPTSTGMTSLIAQTPNFIDLPTLGKDRRPSEALTSSHSMNDIHDIARLRANEYAAKNDSRAPSRQSKLSRMTSRSDLNSLRPSSRAGSFASSIRENINTYIRNRHNTPAEGSMRSGRSSSLGFRSRSRSRSSSIMSRSSSSGWFRSGGLRRRGSWASFRGDRERNKLRKDGGPNLNRPLPALPGLDQYKEAKTHIGQLVKKKKVKKSKIGDPQPLVPIDHPYVPVIPAYVRSNSNLGNYVANGASSAPLPDTDGTEREFPRFDANSSQQQINEERRSTAPEPHQVRKDRSSKMGKRSSLNPVKPRRMSVTADVSMNNEHARRLPPPIIRGASYTRELEHGVYPRCMDVNDGNAHYMLYNQTSGVGGGMGMSGEVERRGGIERGESGGSGAGGEAGQEGRENSRDWEAAVARRETYPMDHEGRKKRRGKSKELNVFGGQGRVICAN